MKSDYEIIAGPIKKLITEEEYCEILNMNSKLFILFEWNIVTVRLNESAPLYEEHAKKLLCMGFSQIKRGNRLVFQKNNLN